MKVKHLLRIILFILCSMPLICYTQHLKPSSKELFTDFNLSFTNSELLEQTIKTLREKAYSTANNVNLKTDLASFLLLKINLNMSKPYSEKENLLLEASDLIPGNFYLERLWGSSFLYKGDYEKALEHFESALYKKPDDIQTASLTGLAALQCMQYEKALEYFDAVYAKSKRNFGLLYSMGKCHFELKELEIAIDYWEQAKDTTQNEKQILALSQAINQAKELMASISGGTSEENQRFIIHFAGNSQEDLGDITTDILEEIYTQVTDDLLFKPDVKVYVTFYLTKDYYKINKNWSAGAASGLKIMIPLKSGYKSPAYMKGLLAHEFTHAVIHVLTKARCPLWLNEGMAQYEEFLAGYGSHETMRTDYEKIFQNDFIDNGLLISLKKVPQLIQSPRTRNDIAHGYIASYMAVRFIADRYSETCLSDILTDLGKGKTMNEVIHDNTNSEDMDDFQTEFNNWLRNY